VEGSGVHPFPHFPAHGTGEARHLALLHGRGLVPGQRQGGGLRQSAGKLGEVYEGANIVALDWCDVPSRPRARNWLSAAIKTPEDILFMLQECNPHLPTKDWKVVKVVEHEGDVNQAVLDLN